MCVHLCLHMCHHIDMCINLNIYIYIYVHIVAHVALSGQSDVTDVFVKSQPLVKRDRYHVGNLTNI